MFGFSEVLFEKSQISNVIVICDFTNKTSENSNNLVPWYSYAITNERKTYRKMKNCKSLYLILNDNLNILIIFLNNIYVRK